MLHLGKAMTKKLSFPFQETQPKQLIIDNYLIAQLFTFFLARIFWPEFLKQLRPVRITSRQGHNMKDIMQHSLNEKVFTLI